MAYLVGMLANAIPLPGGFLAVEGGLVGMLAAVRRAPASVVIAAVLMYRAISLWVPALIGSLAFLSLRREIGKPIAPARPGLSALAGAGRVASATSAAACWQALPGQAARSRARAARRSAPERPGQ